MWMTGRGRSYKEFLEEMNELDSADPNDEQALYEMDDGKPTVTTSLTSG